jgi:hypothetical protein
MSTVNQDFLNEFAEATGMSSPEAETEWMAFSYQLSAEEREKLENGGSEAGRSEGARFLKIYPVNEPKAENVPNRG